MQIFCFGDSIAYGAWDEEGGWADRLKRYLHRELVLKRGKWVELYNLGVSGQRVDHLARRFKEELACRLDTASDQTLILLAIGSNDSAYIKQEEKFKTVEAEFKKGLDAIIKQARQVTSQVFMLTIAPVNEAAASTEDKERKNEYVDHFNELIQQSTTQNNVTLIDANALFKTNDANALLCDDGLHPNSQGHQLIFELVKEKIAHLSD